MTKTIRLLSVLLVVQIALAAGLVLNGNTLSAAENDKPLFAFKADAIDRISIDGPNQSHVVLAKSNGHWQLPDMGNFPADDERVKRLLDRIDRLKLGEPVATTSGARERFKVAEKSYERRLVIDAGNKTLGTLYLGTSPAMRQVHARLNADDAIYAVNLATYEIPVKAAEWEDRTVLQIPQHDIAGIDVDGLQLRRAAAEQKTSQAAPAATANSSAKSVVPTAAPTMWQAAQLSTGEHIDAAAVDKLAGQLADLRIGDVLGKTAKPEYGLDNPALQLTVVRKDGKSVQYQFGKMTAGTDYVLKSSLRDEYFELPTYLAQSLLGAAKRQALVPSTAVASADAAKDEKHPPRKTR